MTALIRYSWSLPSLEGTAPLARVGHTGTGVGSTRIYYFGGYGVRYGYSTETHILDTALLSWSRPYLNGAPPTARVGHTAVALGALVYIYGGAANEKMFRDLYVLDTLSMSWIEPPTSGLPPGPLFGHTAELVGQCLFLFGGCREVLRHGTYASMHGRSHASSKLHVLDTGTMTWSKPNVAGTIPLPRYRHASAMHGSLMFMFGGLGGGADLFALDTGIIDERKNEKDPMRRIRRRGSVRDASESGAGNDLIPWLEGLGLGKYTRVFVRQEVDFETLVELSVDDLREMGITALGPRKKLVAAISSLRGLGTGKYSTADLYQGRYKLEETASMGGLNSVKLAIDMKTERKVALKFMTSKESFLREVSFLKQLRSEYVVELIDYYEDPNNKAHCVVLEYGERSLADYLKRGPLQRNERKFIVDRIGHVVQHMHAQVNATECD